MMEIPDTLPVMVLEDCNLFPHGMLPLFIFEERYRAMLRDALDSHRMFCIGTVDPSRTKSPDRPQVFDFSTAGLIRACVGNDDGTSNLILQGLHRIHLTGFDDSAPFWQAKTTIVPSQHVDSDNIDELFTRLRELIEELASGKTHLSEKVLDHLGGLEDPSALADVAAYNFITSPCARQVLLGVEEVDRRLELVIAKLEKLVESQKES